jgi:hypothetical protein
LIWQKAQWKYAVSVVDENRRSIREPTLKKPVGLTAPEDAVVTYAYAFVPAQYLER